MSPLQIDARIISNEKVEKNYYLLKLEVPSSFKDAQPGQFVHIKVSDADSGVLLRRPLSIHKLITNKTRKNAKGFILKIIYEVKGRGTLLLSKKSANETLNILGPLGQGFKFDETSTDKINIFVAGGMGIAPLVFLIDSMCKIKGRSNNIVLIGAANKNKILCQMYLKELGCDVKIATEDGSAGFKGTALKLLENKVLPSVDIKNSQVYACGPKGMLASITKICMIKKIPLQVSLEEFMGCGIGACLGCAIQTKSGFKRVCHDGPVFDAKDIVWEF